MDVETFRDKLLRKRGELMGGTASKPLQWTMENNSGRQGDMADQASGNNEVHIQLKLKQTDAKILQAIDGALRRIDEGTYGVCRDCGEPIAEARLDRDSVDALLHQLQGKTGLTCTKTISASFSSTSLPNGWRFFSATRRRRAWSATTISTTRTST